MDIISFPSLAKLSESELSSFVGTDIKKEDGNWNNEAHSNGVVVSSYYNLNLGGKAIPTYGVRTTEGMHSFATVSLKAGSTLDGYVSFEDTRAIFSIEVLPSSLGANPVKEGRRARFQVNKPGSYTLILDGDYSKALTVFVYEKEELSSDCEETVLSPGDHGLLSFPKEKTAYRFQKGIHYVDRIDFRSNCEILLEEGAMLIANVPSKDKETPLLDPDWAGEVRYPAFFNADSCANIAIKGHGIIDLTSLPWHARLGLYFSSCSNIALDGFLMNGSPEWTLELFGCSNAKISNVSLFGYRQNSDGFAIVDSDHVEVTSCFARSGDDLFEVKTMDPNRNNKVEEITFSSCVAWPDKCRGYGIIHETKRDISNVNYEDIAIIKAPADWMDALGCLNVIVAGDAKISDVSFKNVEINDCSFYPINVSLLSDSASGSIEGISFENISIPNSNPIRILNASSSGSISNISFSSIYRSGNEVSSSQGLNLKKEGSIGEIKLV